MQEQDTTPAENKAPATGATVGYIPGVRYYGRGWRDRLGTPEDTTRCIVAQFDEGERITKQCRFGRGYGPKLAYCKRHARHVDDGELLPCGTREPPREPTGGPL